MFGRARDEDTCFQKVLLAWSKKRLFYKETHFFLFFFYLALSTIRCSSYFIPLYVFTYNLIEKVYFIFSIVWFLFIYFNKAIYFFPSFVIFSFSFFWQLCFKWRLQECVFFLYWIRGWAINTVEASAVKSSLRNLCWRI